MPGEKLDYDYEIENGWGKWQTTVLRGMKELNERLVDLDVKVDAVQSRQDQMSGAWKAVSVMGAVAVAVAMIVLGVLALFF